MVSDKIESDRYVKSFIRLMNEDMNNQEDADLKNKIFMRLIKKIQEDNELDNNEN